MNELLPMQVELVSIYPLETDMLGFLYMMLAQRRPEANISHRAMPTWEQHCQFVRGQPYRDWWLILPPSGERPSDAMPWIGNAYVTKQNEVGIFLLDAYQGKHYGEAVLDQIKVQHDELLANIAPGNDASRAFFDHRGFELIQNTYRWSKDETKDETMDPDSVA